MKHGDVARCALTLTALLAVVAGCGGGGGGGSPALSLVSGTYSFVAFSGTDGTPDEASASWGEITADGAGMITGGTSTDNENGVLGTLSAVPTLPYTVDAARTFSLLSGGVPAWTGRVSANGQLAALGAVLAGESPGMILMGRKSGTSSAATVAGTYHWCVFGYDQTSMKDSAYWGSLAFDGVSTANGSFSHNESGSITSVGSTPATYAVAADGTITLSFGTDAYTGAVLAGGDLLILAGGTVATNVPLIMALIRTTSGASSTLLSGSYRFVGLKADNAPPPEWSSATVDATADGISLLTLAPGGIGNEDGVVGVFPSGGGPSYAVGSDGALDVSVGLYEGGVAPSGNFAMFAGQTGGASSPEFYFLVR